MNVTGPLPEGIKSIEVEDLGVGEFLVVIFENGYRVTLDGLRLGFEGQCGVGLYLPTTGETYINPRAYIGFGGNQPVEAGLIEPQV